ncbi:hypothetical protein CWI82_03680 [Pseudidiomarina tainanensis]|uniref:Uncharacterized protein n=1 Tax=Pseudidiomarina tainanensis TaxID=502365 RepID=A0ACD2HII8_9GAMM|nr:hypothetical protein [Pseudidiomarina tainanensis]RZQ56416.1 hypothetical protein CWI82_03680 [Pseudidiomarina tainanensis]
MVVKPCRTSVHRYVIASSLALSCLWSTSVFATSCPVYQFSGVTALTQQQTQRQTEPETRQAKQQPARMTDSRASQLVLHEGLLQPQLEQFLRKEFAVETIDWRVSPHYQWPTNFTLKASNAEALLEQILAPYTFVVTMFANHAAIVSYRYEVAEAL